MNLQPIFAEPLQGYAERESALQNSPNLQGSTYDSNSIVTPGAFTPPIQQAPTRSLQLPPILNGDTLGGQDESWVNWQAWEDRVTNVVWAPLMRSQFMMWGQTWVCYDVTRDRHIKITRIYTPDPSGESGRVLASRIMQLDGNPILEFPSESRQIVHHTKDGKIAPPIPCPPGGMFYLPGQTEHHVSQW
jgi:hypothetical protein